MTLGIFYLQGASKEEWLVMNSDGSVVHRVEDEYDDTETRYTVSEAKNRWPGYAGKLEGAYRRVKGEPNRAGDAA